MTSYKWIYNAFSKKDIRDSLVWNVCVEGVVQRSDKQQEGVVHIFIWVEELCLNHTPITPVISARHVVPKIERQHAYGSPGPMAGKFHCPASTDASLLGFVAHLQSLNFQKHIQKGLETQDSFQNFISNDKTVVTV